MENEVEAIRTFTQQKHISDHIPEMERALNTCIGYQSRVGFLCNEAEYAYEIGHLEAIRQVESNEDMTEVQRAALMKAKLAPQKKALSDLKVLRNSLKTIQMSLMQAVNTRRMER